MLFIYLQIFSGAYIGVTHIVPSHYLLHGYPVSAGNASQGLATFYLVAYHVAIAVIVQFCILEHLLNVLLGEVYCDVVLVDAVLVLYKFCYDIICEAQHVWLVLARNDILDELWVQCSYLLYVGIANFCYLLEMKVLCDNDSVGCNRDIRLHGAYSMVLIECHNVVSCNKSRQVTSGFVW